MVKWDRTAFLIGAAAGAAAAILIQKQTSKSMNIPPEKVLKKVKETFKQNGPVDGSWIQMKPEQIDNNGFPVLVYKGGISRPGDSGNTQFEFSADAKTGTLLNVQPV
ncbi:PepSY domain-containing protein [Domibacillus sp. 8LH]|uniref:PepSY domain-containing protein n=1 Tax=Domibacillus TaxID=1433999 RepID=UPI001F59B2FB|nr:MULTISPECIES: PepSY domain-containing protein [Domibacillus]MCI2254287.1 PepSY domain-containing protein [Domibacillus sp. PGB-M46]MCM3786998.1 PepSY domain-containing protein [Domibacillus indicus]